MLMKKKGKTLNIMNSDISSPFYYRVAETLKGRILSGKYKYGSFLPSESGLESEFGVSNITIRKALSLLVQDGLIERKRATGTRILYKEEERLIIKITGNFLDWYNSAYEKLPYEVEVIEIVITECPEKIRTILSLGKDEKIWRMTRIRKIKGEPISFYMNYAPPELLGRLSAKDFKDTSFLKVFQKKCKIKLSHMEQNITAINADIDLSDILQVDFGAPLLFSETIYYSDKSNPMEVTHMYYRGDRYTYRATLPLDILIKGT
jgi:GntR family transcriptional regulator